MHPRPAPSRSISSISTRTLPLRVAGDCGAVLGDPGAAVRSVVVDVARQHDAGARRFGRGDGRLQHRNGEAPPVPVAGRVGGMDDDARRRRRRRRRPAAFMASPATHSIGMRGPGLGPAAAGSRARARTVQPWWIRAAAAWPPNEPVAPMIRAVRCRCRSWLSPRGCHADMRRAAAYSELSVSADRLYVYACHEPPTGISGGRSWR